MNFNPKRWFKRKPKEDPKAKPHLLFGKYEIIPAFDFKGETFYMHKDPLNTLAGRGLTSMMYMEELIMRCDVAYLQDYCKAMRKIWSDPTKIDIFQMATITSHLEERINLLAAIPEHVYKLASVVFFTMEESPFLYNQEVGLQRVKEWKETAGMYDFFLQTPLVQLIPSLALPENNSAAYLDMQSKISEIHYKALHQVLYSGTLTGALTN